MKILKRLKEQFIEWLTFDPQNPICGLDPRTGKVLQGNDYMVWHKVSSEWSEKGCPHENSVLAKDIQFWCSRFYYKYFYKK